MLLSVCGGGTYMCLWFPVYPWVGLLIVVCLLKSALECRYARLWYL